MKHAGKLALVLLLGLSAMLPGASAGGVTVEGVNEVPSAPTVATVTTTTTDSLDTTTAVRPVACAGNPTIYVRAIFSTAGATCTLEVERYTGTVASPTDLGTAYIGTLTASTSRKTLSGTYYRTDQADLVVDSGLANVFDVRVVALSAGTVKITRWCGGADSKAPK